VPISFIAAGLDRWARLQISLPDEILFVANSFFPVSDSSSSAAASLYSDGSAAAADDHQALFDTATECVWKACEF
jgi:hypothetical protein